MWPLQLPTQFGYTPTTCGQMQFLHSTICGGLGVTVFDRWWHDSSSKLTISKQPKATTICDYL